MKLRSLLSRPWRVLQMLLLVALAAGVSLFLREKAENATEPPAMPRVTHRDAVAESPIAPVVRSAPVPMPTPASASLHSSKPQPGHFPGITVINAPAPPPTMPPPGTPRTPLVWEKMVTPSGKRLLVAKPDATWDVPMTAPTKSKSTPR